MTLTNAIEIAKQKAAGTVWEKSVAKAAAMLATGELVVTLLADDTALVTSPNGSYRVNGQCPCAARTAHCYHRAAKRLVEMMEETAPVAVSPAGERETIIAEIKSNWPSDISLADELMARFRKNQLEMLSIDFLTAIHAAIV